MDVKQVYGLVNDATQETLGESDLKVAEDLSNLVDVGSAVLSSSTLRDKYCNAIVNRIGKRVFVDRTYNGLGIKVLMDNWEFGSILSKIQIDIQDADENETWELQNGASYDVNIYTQPSVSEKFFTSLVTFEIPMSITDKQLRQSFISASEMNAFVNAIYNMIDKSMTIKVDGLTLRTIDNFIGETLYDDYGANDYGASSGVKAVNLLYEYNQFASTPITASECLTNKEFLRYASYRMGTYVDRLKGISSLFNIGGKARFTPNDKLHVVLLSDFKNAVDNYLSSDTFHNELVALPNATTIPYWQGSGTNYAFGSISKIDIKTSGNNLIECDGILGVMFDYDALGINIADKRVTTHYNGKGEFNNMWTKWDARYFNDKDENFVVFFVKDAQE